MTSTLRTALLILPLLLVSGCAFINSFNSNLDKQVDVWMAQHEYAKIIDTLKYIHPSNPEYKLLMRKRRQAIIESKRYEQEQIITAINQMEKGQWHEADLTLNNAMEKLPDSRALRNTYQEFIAQRKQYLQSLHLQLNINRAEWLIKNKPIEQQLERTIPEDDTTQERLADFKQNTQQVYQRLLACGANAHDKGDTELEQQCYQLADKLQPGPELKRKLATIRANLQEKQQSKQKATHLAKTLSLLGRNLLEKSKKALQAGNLKLALNHYNQIPDNDKQFPEVSRYGKLMKRLIHENVNQGIELGRKLYSQGQVEQALAVWSKLRQLEPDNENLLSHIDRADRVMQKIKQLRKEQSPATPIQPGNSGK